MTRHYPDLGSASDWLSQISRAARPIRNITQVWVVTRDQYGIARFSDVFWRGNQWWRRQMSAVYSVYFKAILKLQSSQVKRTLVDIINESII